MLIKLIRLKSKLELAVCYAVTKNYKVKEVIRLNNYIVKQWKLGNLLEEEIEEWWELVPDSPTKQDIEFATVNCYSEIAEFASRLHY